MNESNKNSVEVTYRKSKTSVKVAAGLAGAAFALTGCGDSKANDVFSGPSDTYVVEGGDSHWGIASSVKQNIGDSEGSVHEYLDEVQKVAPTDLVPLQGIQLPVAADVDPTRSGIQLIKPE